MNRNIDVSATHISGELIKVEFAHSYLISDHPATLGGKGKGPTPASLLLGALISSVAMDIKRVALKHEMTVGPITVRASQRIDQEGFSSELQNKGLPAKSFLGQIWLRADISGRIDEQEKTLLLEAMEDNHLLLTLENGLELHEDLAVSLSDISTIKAQEKNPVHLQPEHNTLLPEGESRTLIRADDWRVSAVPLDEGSCILNFGNTCQLVAADEKSQIGPSPEELFMGALAACTTVYVARNAALSEMRFSTVTTNVSAHNVNDSVERYTALEKKCVVTGHLDDKQKMQLEHIARFCAIGVTLEQGVFVDKELVTKTGEVKAAIAPLDILYRPVPLPRDYECDDGACCLPG